MNALAGAGLGVVLLSAPVPLYGWYADLGPVALDHQRVGGALMKVSAVVVHAGAAVWIVTRRLHRLSAESEPAAPRFGRCGPRWAPRRRPATRRRRLRGGRPLRLTPLRRPRRCRAPRS
jgi:hypothetical protein